MAISLRTSVLLRIVIIVVISLVMLIPTAMIEGLIYERERYRDTAVFEVSDKWGGEQTLAGLIIMIPHKVILREKETDDKGKSVVKIVGEKTEYIYLLPEILNIEAELTPEIRKRGIYDIPLYAAAIRISGSFSTESLRELSINQPETLEWENAVLSIGISDLKGIRERIPIIWKGKELEASPYLLSREVIGNIPQNSASFAKPLTGEFSSYDTEAYPRSASTGSGVSVKLSEPSLKDTSLSLFQFSLTLQINGSESFRVVPVGKVTTVKISSNWTTPSAVGAYLPESPLNATADGFSGTWKVLHLNRDFPQAWVGASYQIYQSAFGVKLRLPIDDYQKNTRSVKYALMFIALTFLSFIMTELLNKFAIHPIQYLLIGLALVIFYVLLLSLSEQIGFNSAYIVSSVAVIGLISLYAKSILHNNRAALFILGVLIILYGLLFTILQLQDYALLLGGILLFVVLALVMVLTRHIDWFNSSNLSKES